MPISVNYNEVRQLTTLGYERVYNDLKATLLPEEFIFAKWEAGFGGVLQWTLPDDIQWQKLTNANLYDRNAVISTFLTIQRAGLERLSMGRTDANLLKFINDIYTVPSEDFVYYAIDANGHYRIMLAGWGHAYPNHSGLEPGMIGSQLKGRQSVSLAFTENGEPIPGLPFEIILNETQSVKNHTDNDGRKFLGDIIPGTTISMRVPTFDATLTFTVVNGQDLYQFELGRKSTPVIPPIETPLPTPDPLPVEEKEEEVIIEDKRDISVRFIDTDHRPIAHADARLNIPGASAIIEGLDQTGTIYLNRRDLPIGKPVEIQIMPNDSRRRYSPATVIFDSFENEYEIEFRLVRGSKFLPVFLTILCAALATLLAWILLYYLS